LLTGYSFTTEATAYTVLLIMPNEQERINQVLYQVALFNFSQFLIKEFDIEVVAYNKNEGALKISNFDAYKECEWYEGLLLKNKDLNSLFQQEGVRVLKIANDNLELLLKGVFSEDEYLIFEQQNLKEK
jgi:hypothetical protein